MYSLKLPSAAVNAIAGALQKWAEFAAPAREKMLTFSPKMDILFTLSVGGK